MEKGAEWWGSTCMPVTTLSFLNLERKLSGHSNAILIVFLLPQLSEILKVKLKRLKNGSFYRVKLGLLTLTSNISEINSYGI